MAEKIETDEDKERYLYNLYEHTQRENERELLNEKDKAQR